MAPLGLLLRVWLSIGVQSFGGGTTTLALIRRNAVDIHHWVTEEQFNRDWALCQVTPGINLVALTVLVGRQAAGWRGMVVCLAGLLVPSTLITVLLTVGFVSLRDLPATKGALQGILPATVGLGLMTAVQMSQQPLKDGWRRGWWQLLFSALLLLGSAALLWSGRASVVVVLLVAGVISAVENVLAERWTSRRETAVE